jgi:MraZ protein
VEFGGDLWDSAAVAELILDGGPILLLDGKGRVTIPTRSRDVLKALCEDKLTITKSLRRCLTIFPRPLYESFRAKILAWPMDNDDWRRLFIAGSAPVEIDSASRVLVPPELREWAGIEKDVYLFGMGQRFELWDKARYDAHEASVMASRAPEELRNMVL